MTRDDITKIAEQCGLTDWAEWDSGEYGEMLYKFAELAFQAGADAEAKRIHEKGFVTVGHMRERISAEREACAKVCETEGIGAKYQGDVYAEAIRARGAA